jgi:hypothetical protein
MQISNHPGKGRMDAEDHGGLDLGHRDEVTKWLAGAVANHRWCCCLRNLQRRIALLMRDLHLPPPAAGYLQLNSLNLLPSI